MIDSTWHFAPPPPPTTTTTHYHHHHHSLGAVLCPPEAPVPVTRKIVARIQTLPALAVPVLRGQALTMHFQMMNEPCTVAHLVAQYDTATGELVKRRPRWVLVLWGRGLSAEGRQPLARNEPARPDPDPQPPAVCRATRPQRSRSTWSVRSAWRPSPTSASSAGSCCVTAGSPWRRGW